MKSLQVKWLLMTIIGLLATISITLYFRLDKLNDTIHKLYITNSSNDIKQINNLVFESHFKDDLVLNSFNTSTTIIITFFTVLIALGGYLSFKKLNEDIDKLKESAITIEETAIEVQKAKIKIEETAGDIRLFQLRYIYHVAKTNNNEILQNKNQLQIYFKENKERNIDVYFIYYLITKVFFNLTDIYELKDLYKEEELSIDLIIDILQSSKILTQTVLENTLCFCETGEVSFSGGKATLLHSLFETADKEDIFKTVFDNNKKLKVLYIEIKNILKEYSSTYIN